MTSLHFQSLVHPGTKIRTRRFSLEHLLQVNERRKLYPASMGGRENAYWTGKRHALCWPKGMRRGRMRNRGAKRGRGERE